MFSENQILEVSGPLESVEELAQALSFALRYSGKMDDFTREKHPTSVLWQISKYGDFCLGWYPCEGAPPEGWNLYPFPFDLYAVAHTIRKHLLDYKPEDYPIVRMGGGLGILSGDGSVEKGFLMRVIEGQSDNIRGIQSPSYGLLAFSPYECFYAN